MTYEKISPYDWYLIIEKEKAQPWEIEQLGEVKISIGGPAVKQPYSSMQPLKSFRGRTYLVTSCVLPSEAALEAFNPDFEKFGVPPPKLQDGVTVTYEPESDDATF